MTNKNTLTKQQSKRFDERLTYIVGKKRKWKNMVTYIDIKQHLADELARQKKELIEKLEMYCKINQMQATKSRLMGSTAYEVPQTKETKIHNKAIDQAIKTIKKI